jgi:hypothetical protein
MYRIRHYFALNKPYLPTVRQFSIFPYFKGEKAKLKNKIKELELIRDREIVEKAELIKDHENKIKDHEKKIKELKLSKDREIEELTKDCQKEKDRIKWFHGMDEGRLRNEIVSKSFEKFIANGLLEKEIARLEKEIEKGKADRNLEIARLEADRNLEKIKTVSLLLDFFFFRNKRV